jgi:hypothetical protein
MRIRSFLIAAGALTLLGAPNTVAAQTDPTTAPRALRELLADASKRNVLPPALISFTSHVETEISVVLRREEGTEAVGAVEQVASTLKWNRTGFSDQHIVGYRAQQTGANVSLLSVFQTGWLNPVLYGNRLRVRTNASRRTPTRRDSDRPRTRAAAHRYHGRGGAIRRRNGSRRLARHAGAPARIFHTRQRAASWPCRVVG